LPLIDVHDQEASRLSCAHCALDIGTLDSSSLGAIAYSPKPPRSTTRGGIQDGDEACSEF
jgi:hypothetical protein